MNDLVYQSLEGDRILAIDPISRGVGFVVLEEDQLQLVDWGIRLCTRRDGATCPRVLRHLIARYEPSIVVIEGNESVTSMRYEALGAFVSVVSDVLDASGLSVRTYTRDGIRRVFSRAHAITKEEVARALVTRFPELAPDLPPPRKLWQSEDARMSIFDALSLAVVHLAEKGSREVLDSPRGPLAA
jgi:Holliday junction resolvasome RuvABC endonuclease subunit